MNSRLDMPGGWKMRKAGLFGVILLLLLPLGVVAGDKNPWETELPFKQGTIKYTISGMENGSQITYIRDYGREVATYHTTKTTMMGMTMVNETVDIENPEWSYQFDLTKRTGTKSVNPRKYMIEEYNKLSKAEQKRVRDNGEKMGVSVAEGFGGKVQQKAKKILGFNCDRTEVMGSVVYSIHGTGLPLLVETNMMGMNMKIEATSVDEGKVADSFFQFPQGIEPEFDQQSDAVAREMARQTIAMLKDPESAQKSSGPAMENQQKQMSPEDQEQMQQAMEMLKGMFGNQPQQ